MEIENYIVQNLVKQFNVAPDQVKVKRDRRIYVKVDKDIFLKVLDFAINNQKFDILCTITGFDEGDTFGVMYHLAQEKGIMLNIKINIGKKNAILNTITGIFPNADIYERELADLFGIKVEGLKDGIRYPLPDDWPEGQYPLRKDWKVGGNA